MSQGAGLGREVQGPGSSAAFEQADLATLGFEGIAGAWQGPLTLVLFAEQAQLATPNAPSSSICCFEPSVCKAAIGVEVALLLSLGLVEDSG
jgi:hypothetical protein